MADNGRAPGSFLLSSRREAARPNLGEQMQTVVICVRGLSAGVNYSFEIKKALESIPLRADNFRMSKWGVAWIEVPEHFSEEVIRKLNTVTMQGRTPTAFVFPRRTRFCSLRGRDVDVLMED